MDPKKILAMLGVNLADVEANARRVVDEAQKQIAALHTKQDATTQALKALAEVLNAHTVAVNKLRETIEAHYGRGDNDGRGNAHRNGIGADSILSPTGR